MGRLSALDVQSTQMCQTLLFPGRLARCPCVGVCVDSRARLQTLGTQVPNCSPATEAQ